MNAQQINEKAVFSAARRIRDPVARNDYLAEACDLDPAAIQRIQDLLRTHEQDQSYLESPAVVYASITAESSLSESPGTVIGHYKLLQQLGEGGMGVVFMAEQTEPIQRMLALKIIKPGMDTRQVIARFEAERQAVAMMDHPNVAKILDAGTTETGRPYFVMELVKGVSITKYCDEVELPIRARLELFVEVCQAVQHAHQKGIIHRDLKPNNVLVAEYDNRAVPKVIDFGVAKATAQKLTERTMFTEFGQLIGTFEYMSPEQAKLNQLDVDTRSDIYSLGVLLYELLTGTTPLERHRLETIAFDETLRIIREEDAPKPSTRLKSGTVPNSASPRDKIGRSASPKPTSLATIAANRRTEPARLTKEIRGDLDWIVMKALEKDRNRRYESAGALAADITRYLGDEPITAMAPSRLYRFRKFVRRNQAAVIASGAVLAGLLACLIGMAVGLVSESRQRAAAEREQAEAQLNLGLSLQSQAKYAEAEALFRQALETNLGATLQDRQRAARMRLRLAQMTFDQGDKIAAERLHREALSAYRAAFPPGDPNIAQALGELATILQVQKRFEESEPLIREAHNIHRAAAPIDHFMIATSGTLLGNVLVTLGRFAEAEPILRTALAEHQQVVPPNVLAIGLTRTVLGRDLIMLGRFSEAEEQLVQCERELASSEAWRHGSLALAALYTTWNQVEPDKGYDAKAREWFRKSIEEYLHPLSGTGNRKEVPQDR